MSALVRILLFLSIGLFSPLLVSCETYYVDPTAMDGGDGSESFPFRTIGEGLQKAVYDDTLMLLPGVFTGPGNYDLTVVGVDIIGSGSLEDENQTIIDLQNKPFGHLTGKGKTLADLIMKNGAPGPVFDGTSGVVSISSSDAGWEFDNCAFVDIRGVAVNFWGVQSKGLLTIRSCVFMNVVKPYSSTSFAQAISSVSGILEVYDSNFTHTDGIRVQSWALHLLVKDTYFGGAGNTGGGIYGSDFLEAPSLLVDGCMFEGNVVEKQGSAIWFDHLDRNDLPEEAVVVSNTVFENNVVLSPHWSDYHSALALRADLVLVENVTFVNNSCSDEVFNCTRDFTCMTKSKSTHNCTVRNVVFSEADGTPHLNFRSSGNLKWHLEEDLSTRRIYLSAGNVTITSHTLDKISFSALLVKHDLLLQSNVHTLNVTNALRNNENPSAYQYVQFLDFDRIYLGPNTTALHPADLSTVFPNNKIQTLGNYHFNLPFFLGGRIQGRTLKNNSTLTVSHGAVIKGDFENFKGATLAFTGVDNFYGATLEVTGAASLQGKLMMDFQDETHQVRSFDVVTYSDYTNEFGNFTTNAEQDIRLKYHTSSLRARTGLYPYQTFFIIVGVLFGTLVGMGVVFYFNYHQARDYALENDPDYHLLIN